MNYNTVYVGMDVHKESFTLCSMTIEDEKASHYQKTEADYKNVLKYLEFLRTIYGDNAKFICGYEAGCLSYTLYHQLMSQHMECVILAPTTMREQRSRKRIKTDKRDTLLSCLYEFLLEELCSSGRNASHRSRQIVCRISNLLNFFATFHLIGHRFCTCCSGSTCNMKIGLSYLDRNIGFLDIPLKSSNTKLSCIHLVNRAFPIGLLSFLHPIFCCTISL